MTIVRRDLRPSRRQMLALMGGGAAASLLTRSHAEAQGVDPRINEIVSRTISVDMHNHVRAAVVRDPSAPRPADPVADVAGEMKRSGFTAVCATYALDGSGGAGEGWPQNAKPGEYYSLHQQYLDAYDRLIAAQKIRRVLHMRDLQAAHDQGVPAIIQDSEGVQWIEGHLERVAEAYRRGARVLQLVHFSPDLVKPLGDAQGRAPVGGLTPFGADVIKECNRLGIVVDLAHGALEMVKGAQKVATQPFVVTHTAMDSAVGRGTTSDGLRSRLLSRDHAKIVADAGGVIGIWNLFPTTKDYVSAVKEMVDVVGADHVGLGSDTSIATNTNSKWPDQNGGFLYAVTREMLGQGFAPAEISKIAGGNFCRVFAKVTGVISVRFLKSLYVQVLIGITCGVILGILAPDYGAAMKPLGDGFIKLVKMLISPIIFTTVVLGIAKVGAMKDVGRIGLKALFYFEVVSTLALVIGLVVVNVLKPGAGLNFNPASVDASAMSAYANSSTQLSTVDFLLRVIPDTFVSAFTGGEILQVLLVSILVGVVLLRLGDRVTPLVTGLDQISHVLFDIIALIMRAAPVGAFGAMAFTVGRFGLTSLLSLGQLMASFYLTCLLFIFVVLGAIARMTGFSLWRLLRYISGEILIVLGTSSSETVLPRLMAKLERVGCSKAVVGLVVPTGYSFNLDGTSIYMTMAAVFIAQASGIDLTLGQELGMLGVLLLTSKGAAAVTGGGFVTLAATLAVFPSIPMAGLTLLIGIDRFMSEARAITNLIGNSVATMVVARWEGALDLERAREVLSGEAVIDEEVSGESVSPKARLEIAN